MRGRTFEDLKGILLAGGGLNMSAENFRLEHLQQLAIAANGARVRLVLRDVHNFSADQLKTVAFSGGKHVIFSDEGEPAGREDQR